MAYRAILGLVSLLAIAGAGIDSLPVGDNNNNEDNGNRCGYASCPQTQTDKINVHLVPHTHDDVGWLKTVDQYYYGTKKRYAWPGVQYILDSVIPQLVMDKNKRFIYVEMSFFSKWWQDQNDDMKETVKKLVNQGRLEFINGGWCMNDEAATTYQSIIDQMTIGLKFLEENFGQCGRPRVGWQIDPFGHSNEQASLFAQFGFDGMFFERIDYLEKTHLATKKSLDLIWRADEALQSDTGSIYTNVFIDGYDSPTTFCFDAYCLDPNLVDNNRSYEYNIEERVSSFAGYVKYYAMHKNTNHVMIPMGGDFQYTSAHQNFRNLDKLISNLNRLRPDLNVFYSTPSCYQYTLNEAGKLRNITWPKKLNDFFPYGSDPHAYWTGYFTSRPSVKLFERGTSTLLQATRQASIRRMISNLLPGSGATADKRGWNMELRHLEGQCLEPLWQVMGDLQHHDAVTGTEKQHVANDYIRRGTDAINQCMNTISLTSTPIESGTLWCPALNISHCWATEYYLRPASESSDGLKVSIYNPLAESLTQIPIRLPCPAPCDIAKISVRDLSSRELVTPLIKVPLNAGLDRLNFRVSLADEEIQFYASIPPVGYNSYVILAHNQTDSAINSVETKFEESSTSTNRDPFKHLYNTNLWIRTSKDLNEVDLALDAKDSYIMNIPFGSRADSRSEQSNDKQFLTFNLKTGLVEGIRINDDFLQTKQQFGFYYPSDKHRSSGAYIMRPNSTIAHMLDVPVRFKIFQSGYVYEIHQQWNDWIWQTIRVDAHLNYVEYDYVVGPLPIEKEKKIGIEVISRYSTDLDTSGMFYTDSNGRQMMARKRLLANMTTEPVAANYYPVTTTMLLKDPNPDRPVDFAILTDRAQGGTSLHDGQLEFLIHRRLLLDDNFGVSEPLNEPGEDGRGLTIRGQHRLFFNFLVKSKDARTRVRKRDQDYQIDHSINGSKDINESQTSLLIDSNLDQLRKQSIKFLLRPIITFEPIKKSLNKMAETTVSSHDRNESIQCTSSLLNSSLPSNIHLLTLQPWKDRQLLIRLENTHNPLTFHKSMYPDNVYKNMLGLYKEAKEQPNNEPKEEVVAVEDAVELKESPRCKRLRSHYQRSRYNGRYYTHRLPCANYLNSQLKQQTSSYHCLEHRSTSMVVTKFDIEYLIKNVRIVDLQETILGANENLDQVSRLNWNTSESTHDSCDTFTPVADNTGSQTTITLGPRQIRTYLARIVKL